MIPSWERDSVNSFPKVKRYDASLQWTHLTQQQVNYHQMSPHTQITEAVFKTCCQCSVQTGCFDKETPGGVGRWLYTSAPWQTAGFKETNPCAWCLSSEVVRLGRQKGEGKTSLRNCERMWEKIQLVYTPRYKIKEQKSHVEHCVLYLHWSGVS
jgi:hypothetical protein